ncbi:sugar phosphate nucleotidyltransferase [Promicromonospora sp. NPDC057488]|uniref:sugar phosphate nucleotidyltransferase n=1 Tax=Promicromonospora sp. NPDC057488 TaxID=3346147 RepID=UPI00366EEF3F
MVKKAVIAVAGFGSRFFPVAKSINKCMLPVLNRPVVDFAVEDCLAAGVERIAFVVAPGEGGRQVRHYFSHDPDIESHFKERGWEQKYEQISGLHQRAEFSFIEQPRDGRYGTALPAMLAEDFVADDDFFLIAGDDLLFRPDGGSDLADLAAARDRAGVAAALGAAVVPGADAGRYGVLTTRDAGARFPFLDAIVEKPASFTAPEAYANISRSLLPAAVLPYFRRLQAAENGEYQATDAIGAFAEDHDTLIHPVGGRYFDCGNTSGWLAANLFAAENEN